MRKLIAVSLLALIFWGLTKDAFIALVLAMLADGVACIPTLIKSYYHPETEDSRAYLLAGISALITLASIQTWTFLYYGFPLWTLLICAAFTLLIKFRLEKIIHA